MDRARRHRGCDRLIAAAASRAARSGDSKSPGAASEISFKRLGLLAGAITPALILMIALILAGWPQDAGLRRWLA